MLSRMIVVGLGTLALSGCGGGTEPAPVHNDAPTVNSATGGNDNAAVLAMPDGTRRLTLARALADANIPCDGVVKAVRTPDVNNLATWRAECKNGSKHAITITPDGTANIVSRND